MLTEQSGSRNSSGDRYAPDRHSAPVGGEAWSRFWVAVLTGMVIDAAATFPAPAIATGFVSRREDGSDLISPVGGVRGG
jgi:hypothetical protein